MLKTRGFFSAYCIIGSVTVLLSQTGDPPVIPKGTQISARTLDSIQSKQGEVGQNYRCTMDAPVSIDGNEPVSKALNLLGRQLRAYCNLGKGKGKSGGL
jgi:hypothetical protein